MRVDLNCDLGEGGPADADLVKLISSANVSGGLHAGDPMAVAETVRLAAASGVAVGVHPGYGDREHFGRRELPRTRRQLLDELRYQFGAVSMLAQAAGTHVRYLKPHGALYHQAARDAEYAAPVVALCAERGLALLGPPDSQLERLSARVCNFIPEGYADRRYQRDGTLVPRDQPGAFVTDPDEAVAQAERLLASGKVRSICVHGDNPEALAFVAALHATLVASGHVIMSFA